MSACINCSSTLSRFATKYCSNSCQQKYTYSVFIKQWLNNPHSVKITVNISRYILKYLFIKYKNACGRCGWGAIHPITNKVPLEVDHINGNSSDNRELNLILLCPNCHSLTSTFRNLNKGNGRVSRLKNYGKI